MPFAYALALVVVITLLGVLSLIFYADFKREIARRYPTVDWSHKSANLAVVAASLIGLVAFLAYILL